MLLLAFALSYLAMLALSMAMSRHHKALFTVAASPARQRLLRPLAGLALGGAAGVLGGNTLAQRLGGRTLQRLFALMLVAVSLSLAAQKLLGGH